MARKPAVMYRRLKGPAYTRRKYIGGVPNNRIHQYHVETDVQETASSKSFSNFAPITMFRFATPLSKPLVSFPTPPSVRRPAHKAMPFGPHLPPPRAP